MAMPKSDTKSMLRVALAEQADLFRLLVDSVRDYAIFMLDETGHVATWNVGAERLKGYRADEIIGRHFSTFYSEAEAKSGKCDVELELAARDGRFEDEGWRVRKDGSRFWANVVISAVRDSSGALVGFSKVTRDLTDRRRAEDERAGRLAAERANRAKDEFLAILGHELRNPLAPISTALQLLKLRGGPPSRELQVIERQLGHVLRLVDDLLDVSRIVQGRVELKCQRLDLREVIAKAIEIASVIIEQKGHRLDVHNGHGPLFVDGDEARLVQVFSNLLVNAAKYTDPGGHIAIAVREVADEVVADVIDDGTGIDASLLPRVFDLFVQGHQGVERSQGGLGLGLALVRTLVERHSGSVDVHSAGIGKGSTFTVRLPRLDIDAASTSTQPAAPVQSVSMRRRVLIVDDNDDALMVLGDLVSAAGHDVRTAGDPAMALAVARAFHPEVCVLDIGLPVMDGYELASRLRSQGGDEPLTLIALTGYGQQSDRTRSEAAGFDAHFVKPVDLKRLIATIGKPRS
jgi:PAS domain S-box-containing protein